MRSTTYRSGRVTSLYISLGIAFALLFGLGYLLLSMGPSPIANRDASSRPVELLVYCAAGLRGPMEKIAAEYERDHRVKVQLQFGGTNTLLTQVRVSRLGDLFVSADESYLTAAHQEGLVRETLGLAIMRPVIAVRQGNPKSIRTVKDLSREDIKVALANPDQAAVGQLTRKLLIASGDWDAIHAQVTKSGVFKPTVHEVANDVKLGSVDAAIVWDSTVASYPELEMISAVELQAGTGNVAAGVLSSTAVPTETLRFARYLSARDRGLPHFKKLGFTVVDGDRWAEHPEVTFFCGSVNRRAVESIIEEFEQREGVTVNTVFNGCGILTAQMRSLREKEATAGFPDMYMACDRYYLEAVKEWFQDDVDLSDTEVVIAVPRGNPANIQTLADLTREGVRVSVGQPEQCTIGVLTRQLLEGEGIYDAVMKNVIMQTTSSALLIPTVTTNSVDATLAYATDTRAEGDKVESLRIGTAAAKAIQPFAIARASDHKELGRRLLRKMVNSRAQFESAGFHFRPDSNTVPALDGSSQ